MLLHTLSQHALLNGLINAHCELAAAICDQAGGYAALEQRALALSSTCWAGSSTSKRASGAPPVAEPLAAPQPCIPYCLPFPRHTSEHPALSRAPPPPAPPPPPQSVAELAGAAEQLPLEIPLGPEFVFHSIFACPVSRDQVRGSQREGRAMPGAAAAAAAAAAVLLLPPFCWTLWPP